MTSIYFRTDAGGIVGPGIDDGQAYVTGTPDNGAGTSVRGATDDDGEPVEVLATVPDFDARTRECFAIAGPRP